MNRKSARIASIVVFLVLLLSLGVWLWHRRPPVVEPGPKREYLLVPHDLAGKFDLADEDAIVAYCRDKVRPASYHGILRGAHGALWAGEGNDWDRTLLAAEALEGIGIDARIVLTDPPRLSYLSKKTDRWTTLRIGGEDSPELSDEPPEDAAPPTTLSDGRPYFHHVTPALILEDDDGHERRIEPSRPDLLMKWVFQPVVLSAVESADDLKYVLKVGDREVLSSGPLSKVRRAALELKWQFNDNGTTWQRKLYDRGNAAGEAPGNATVRAGDCYAIVTSAGPLVPDVLDTRAAMFQWGDHTADTDELERRLIALGVKYHVDCDEHTRQLMDQTGVKARWTTPRFMIVASEGDGGKLTDAARKASGSGTGEEESPLPGVSLDALSDAVEADGPRAHEFQVARGLANDLIETRIVYEAARVPVISASTVLSHFKSDALETPENRLAHIDAEARRILDEEPIGAKLKLSAAAPISEDTTDKDTMPSLVVERQANGLVVHGIREDVSITKGKITDRYRWDPDHSVAFGKDSRTLAVAADCLLSQERERPNYRLQTDVTPGWPTEPLAVTAGSVLTYKVQWTDKKEYSLEVLVSLNDGAPGGIWSNKPTDVVWVDLRGRYGKILGNRPEVLSTTSLGPAFESYVMPPGPIAEGEKVPIKVTVTSRQQKLDGIKIPWPKGASSLICTKLGRTWHAGVRVRDRGLWQRQDDKYLIRVLGEAQEKWMSPNDFKELCLVAVRLGNDWRFADLLRTDKDRCLVQMLDEVNSEPEWVGSVRSFRFIEVDTGNWQIAELVEAKDGKYRVRFSADPEQDPVWVNKENVRLDDTEPGKDDYLVVLPSGPMPLILGGKRGDVSFVLDQASPVLRGQLVDQDTDKPVVGATVARADAEGHVKSAADGSFAIHLDDPLFPLATFVLNKGAKEKIDHPSVRAPREFHFLVILDQSEAMTYGFDSDKVAPAGKQRQDLLQKEVLRALRRLVSDQDSGRITMWSYAARLNDEELVTELLKDAEIPIAGGGGRHPQFGAVEGVLPKLKPGGKAPLSAAIRKLAEQKNLPADTIVLLLSSGDNAGVQTAAEAYTAGKCRLPVHIFGFGVEPESRADEELRGLAVASAGSLRLTGTSAPHTVPMTAFTSEVGTLPVTITSPCHMPTTLAVPLTEDALKTRRIALVHECHCRDKGKRLLTIAKENMADLDQCEGLTKPARQMIEARVKDGGWTVTIPSRRVNVAGVTAYGWFETETATGRMVGRTEDGLHGSTPAGGNWPSYDPYKSGPFKDAAAQQPFVVWYQGVVAYTGGSVLAAMQWTRQPGFLNGTAEDFKRFVQANALDFTAGWWDQVGAKSFPEQADFFWSGVCLNFSLQSAALGLPSDGCLRRWAQNLCDRAADAVKDAGQDLAGDALNGLLEKSFGKERAALISLALKAGSPGLADDLKGMWGDGVKQGFNCERFRAKEH